MVLLLRLRRGRRSPSSARGCSKIRPAGPDEAAIPKTAALRLRLRQSRVDALRAASARRRTTRRRACQASHARAHAPVCYFDSGVRAMDAGEPRKAAKLFETSIAKADKLPPEERSASSGVASSAAYLAMGRARQMAKDYDSAL